MTSLNVERTGLFGKVLSPEEYLDKAAKKFAEVVKQEERAIKKELRGDRVPLETQIRNALVEIQKQERAERALQREVQELNQMRELAAMGRRKSKSERNRFNKYLRNEGFKWEYLSAEFIEDTAGGEEYLDAVLRGRGVWELRGRVRRTDGTFFTKAYEVNDALAVIEKRIQRRNS